MHIQSPLFAISVIWFFAAVSPGPNFFITVRIALMQSRGLAIRTVAGIATGTAIWALAGYFGIQTIFAVAPWSYFLLKILGGIYLCWMGVRLLWNSRFRSGQRQARGSRKLSSWSAYRLGLATNIANPKTAVFVAGIFAATLPTGAPMREGAIAIVVMASISMTWYSIVALIVAQTRAGRIYQLMSHWIDRVAGLIFLFVGVDLSTSAGF